MLMIDNPVKTQESLLLLKEISYVLKPPPASKYKSRYFCNFQVAGPLIIPNSSSIYQHHQRRRREEGESEINPFAVIVTTIKRLFSKVCYSTSTTTKSSFEKPARVILSEELYFFYVVLCQKGRS